MESEYLTIGDASRYLNVKTSTLYSMVENGGIPHYRLGRMIRFKQEDLYQWMGSHRREVHCVDKQLREAPKTSNGTKLYIDSLLKKYIAEAKSTGYSKSQRETRQEIKGLRKDGDDDGTL